MFPRLKLSVLSLCLLFVAVACSQQPEATAPQPVEQTAQASQPQNKNGWPHGAMVAAANPYAVDAAIAVLERGGNAVDAAIAAHTVLGLVEPQSSGLGGGGLMLVYDRASNTTKLFDGRETAPAGVTKDLFIKDGQVLGFREAWQSGRSVGVPGVVAMYKLAHDKYGSRPWAENFQPAIDLASNGFLVSERMSNMLTRIQQFTQMDETPGSAEYFYPEGQPLPVGYNRTNPDYAHTLSRIATEGIDAFYRGEIAEGIVAAVQAQPLPGTLSMNDLANYQAKIREPLCGAFRDKQVCSTPPPGSGAALIEMMGLYDRMIKNVEGTVDDEDRLLAFVDAQRLGYADRDHFVADSDFISFPNETLFDPDYLDRRVNERFKPDQPVKHGDPLGQAGDNKTAFAPDTTQPHPSTTHLSIVDGYGNAVSFTATVEAPFGSSRWVGGFLLNNELTDFARQPEIDGKTPANVAAPGKRPRSSMSPTIVFNQDGELALLTGSPGGNSIIAYTFKSLLAVLDWGDDPEAALARSNIVARGDQIRVETSMTGGEWAVEKLTEKGYAVRAREGENSGIHLIQVTDNGLKGAADTRREGVVKSTK